MTIHCAGLTAEYNPFHNGHARQLAMLRAQYGDVPVTAVLSGSFIQHGEPALLDKWTRAAAAVDCGVDLVLELPVLHSLRSADFFAAGGMVTLAATGVTDHVFCGVEGLGEGDTDMDRAGRLIQDTACFLRSPAGNEALRRLLREGESYGTAWEKAVRAWRPEAAPLLKGSNNILALAYEKAIGQYGLPLTLHPLPRLGERYTSTQLVPPYASASAIRHFLESGAAAGNPGAEQVLAGVLPAPSAARLTAALHGGTPNRRSDAPGLLDTRPFGDRLAVLLAYFFSVHDAADLYNLCNADAGLCARLYNARAALQDGWQGYLRAVVTKRYAAPVIHRVCLMLLFGLPRSFWTREPRAGCLRVLAFNERGRALLREMKQKAAAPILTKAADAAQYRGADWYPELLADFRATDLWCQLRGFTGLSGLDYTVSPYYGG
ncbi:MAG: nucleotidyltransferase family protein [Succiniclasticum sp.]|nr:nucleotidyltransferase family protein [Succiniclasticum sp.]MEE3479741.1 nucleotidyltransferase family protein [Succiniclasticum sp.]